MRDIDTRDLPPTITPAAVEAAMERARELRCEAIRHFCARAGRSLDAALLALRIATRCRMRAPADRLEAVRVPGFAPTRGRPAPGWRTALRTGGRVVAARCDAP